MSFIKSSKSQVLDLASKTTLFVDMVPNPKDTRVFSMDQWNAQLGVIKQQQQLQNDLNKIHPLSKSLNGETVTYAMTTPFKALARGEDMLALMNAHDLSLRLNVKRPDAHAANHTCMQLSSNALEGLLAQSADEGGLKTIQLRAKADSQAEQPEHGDMFLTMLETNKGHLFSHVDYEITETKDRRLHAPPAAMAF